MINVVKFFVGAHIARELHTPFMDAPNRKPETKTEQTRKTECKRKTWNLELGGCCFFCFSPTFRFIKSPDAKRKTQRIFLRCDRFSFHVGALALKDCVRFEFSSARDAGGTVKTLSRFACGKSNANVNHHGK